MSKLDTYKSLKYFEGDWKIDRIVINKKYQDQSCTGTGKAKFIKPAGMNCVILDETVDLALKNNVNIQGANKKYKYEFNGSKVTQYYEERYGSSSEFVKMFNLSFDGNEKVYARGNYFCNGDAYDCIVTFHDNNKFSILYLVEGMNKNYISTTVFIREIPLSDDIVLNGDTMCHTE